MGSQYEITNKKEFVVFLQNIVKVLGTELTSLTREIEVQASRIEQISRRIKNITQQIVYIESKRKSLESMVDEITASSAKEKSIINTLEEEMEQLKTEARRIDEQIRLRQAQLNSFGILKPLAESIAALIESLSGELRASENKLKDYAERHQEMKSFYSNSAKKLEDYKERFDNISKQKKELDIQQDNDEMEIKKLGVYKTEQEDFKVNLGQFKARAQSLLDTVNMNIEFSDEMLNTKEEIVTQVKEAYSKFNRPLPKELFLQNSSYSSSTYSIYKVSAL